LGKNNVPRQSHREENIMPEPEYGGFSYSYNGSNDSGSSNNWSGNDWAGEFADTGVEVDYDQYAGSYNPNNAIDYGGVNPEYQTYLDNLERHTTDQGFSYYIQPGQSWTDRRDEQLISAFGGLTGEWDALAGLSEDDKNRMWRLGEFPWPLGGSGTRGGGGGRVSGGGYYGGRGGYGGGSGGGGGRDTPEYAGSYAGENPWGQSHIQEAWIRQLRGYNRGGIVSLC
jgi:hypothetical protein